MKAREDLLVDLLAAAFDRGARALAQVLNAPVIARDANDRAVQKTTGLQPVERVEGHHLRQIAGDTEDHQHVGRLGAHCAVGCGSLGPRR